MSESTEMMDWKEMFCLFCWPPCPGAIASKLAFLPSEATYSFQEDEASSKLTFKLSDGLESFFGRSHNRERYDCYFARTARRNYVACMYIRCTNRPKFTILFSHGNAVDMGQVVDFYQALGSSMRCNVLSYDYSGYGVSTGKPSEKNLYADIMAAWHSLCHRFDIPQEKIILYGQSIGTAPTVELASHHTCAGVVLQSPLTSGMRLIFPNLRRSWFFDPFNNIAKVHRIRAPVLVIHGTDDNVIDISHGMQIYERCRNPVEPLWIRGAGHNNIESFPQFQERLQYFIFSELQ